MFAIVGQLLLGWLLADFASGFFHWWEDRVGRADMPVLGRWIIVPNRLHHVRQVVPGANPWGARLATLAVAAPIAVAVFGLFGFSYVLVGMALGAALVNEVHGWAHQPATAPWLVRLLQDTGVFQSPQHHAGHHRGDHDRRYCILTNFVNPWLDAVHFWAALERSLASVGLAPNRGTQ